MWKSISLLLFDIKSAYAAEPANSSGSVPLNSVPMKSKVHSVSVSPSGQGGSGSTSGQGIQQSSNSITPGPVEKTLEAVPAAEKAPKSAKAAKKSSKTTHAVTSNTMKENANAGTREVQTAGPSDKRVQPGKSVQNVPEPSPSSTTYSYISVVSITLIVVSLLLLWRKVRAKGGTFKKSDGKDPVSFGSFWKRLVAHGEITGQTKNPHSIADRMISDRPLMPNDPDPLGYNKLAKTISRFLRNENTEPPLTLAILGKWGTGKSSIMNLVKADLQNYGYYPVYFNAWHHQNEDYFLAALLEAIDNNGFPPWWTLNGLAFRGRLLYSRLQEDPKIVFVVVGLIILQLLATFKLFALPGTYDNTAGMAAFVVTALGFLQGFRTKLNKALKPSSILDLFRIKTFSEKLSFRHKFQKEFSNISKAYHPLKPVIFIDDLDRCKPENVVMILEAVNFLVSSGDCFIVLGMDRDYVLGSVAHQFKDITEDEIFRSSKASNGPPTCAKEERLNFAEHYLEKLINIEIPVPILEADTKMAEKLIMTFANGNLSYENKSINKLGRHKYWFVVVLAVMIVTLVVGINIPISRDSSKSRSTEQVGVEQPAAPIIATAPAPAPVPVINNAVSRVEPLMAGLAVFALFTLALVLSSLTYRRRLKSSGAVTQDSADFIEALRIWYLLIINKYKTPRAIKRFLNNVRYLATCTDVHNTDNQDAKPRDMNESMLVALSVLHYCAPNGICSNDFSAAAADIERNASIGETIDVIKSIHEHNEHFKNLPPTPNVLSDFEMLVCGSRLSFGRETPVGPTIESK